MKKIILSLLLCTVSLQINAAHSSWTNDDYKRYFDNLKSELNSYDADGTTLLIRTIRTVAKTEKDLIQQLQEIQFLIILGADVNLGTLPTKETVFINRTPIQIAVTAAMPIDQQLSIIQLLLQAGADPLLEERWTRMNTIETSLMLLIPNPEITQRNPEITQCLIRHVAQKNIQEKRGSSQSFTEFLGTTKLHKWRKLLDDLSTETARLTKLNQSNMFIKGLEFHNKMSELLHTRAQK